jgi:hypothetical protein
MEISNEGEDYEDGARCVNLYAQNISMWEEVIRGEICTILLAILVVL